MVAKLLCAVQPQVSRIKNVKSSASQIIARRNERRAQCELENKPTLLLYARARACVCVLRALHQWKFFDSLPYDALFRSPLCPRLLSPFDHRGSTVVFLTKRKLPCWEIREKSATTALQPSLSNCFSSFCNVNKVWSGIKKKIGGGGTSRTGGSSVEIKRKSSSTTIGFKFPAFELKSKKSS